MIVSQNTVNTITLIKNNIIKIFARLYAYTLAWHCADKILVIESDDWGAIRTSTPEAYKWLKNNGYEMQKSRWSVDALESDDDLTALFDVIKNFKDSRDRPVCITANMIMANPNFDAIRTDKFNKYYYEPVALSLAKSPLRKSVTKLWRAGLAQRFFYPQFHAREHVRWWQWLKALQNNSPEVLQTFDLNMCGVPLASSKENQSFYAPLYLDDNALAKENINLQEIINQGIELFEAQFGFRSLSTVAPNVTWTDSAEIIWADKGIRYIQGGFMQYLPKGNDVKIVAHHLGEKSRRVGTYLVRNVTFEPDKSRNENYWTSSFKQIKRALSFNVPAIISSHRVNYVGGIDESNRKYGLAQLRKLLTAVQAEWPDVYFLSSPELGYMIENNLQCVNQLEGKEAAVFPDVMSIKKRAKRLEAHHE